MTAFTRRALAGNLRVKEVAVAPGGDGDGDDGARTQRLWSASTLNRPTVTPPSASSSSRISRA